MAKEITSTNYFIFLGGKKPTADEHDLGVNLFREGKFLANV